MRPVLPVATAIFLALSAGPLSAHAADRRPTSDHWLGQHEKGWFWYHSEDDEESKKPKAAPKPLPKPQPKVEKKPEKKVAKKKPDPWVPRPRPDVIEPLKLFFNNPQKNARNFLIYLNRLSNRGFEMAAAIKRALDEDPSIFPLASPGSTYAAAWMQKFQDALQKKVLEKNKGRIGYVFFLRPDSPASVIQVKIANNLHNRGFQVVGITPYGAALPHANFPVQADDGLAKKLGVKAVPSVYMIDMKTRKHISLGHGTKSVFEIQLAELNYLESIGEWKPVTPIDAWDKKNPIYKNPYDRGFNPFYAYKLAKQSEENLMSKIRARAKAAGQTMQEAAK